MKSLVRKYRLKAGLTLAQLGELTGIDPSALSRVERGQRKLTVEDIMAIAQALGCTPRALVPASLRGKSHGESVSRRG